MNATTKPKQSLPKELFRKRLDRSKLMKTDPRECKYIINFDNQTEVLLPPIRPSCFKKHDRNVPDIEARNPYDVPNIQRVFTKSKFSRKTKPIPFIMSDPRTICDIDETFYKKIEGRPLRQPNDIKVYMRTIRDITLFRANAAYLKDQILQIDMSFSVELDEYTTINKFFVKCKDNFVRFAKESYTKAKKIQQRAKNLALKLDDVNEELEALSFQYVEIRNKLADINTTFEMLALYRKFLNTISPIPWREIYDKEYIDTISLESADEEMESEYALTRFLVFNEIEPTLFFKKPRQIELLFDILSRQCLTYMEIDVMSSNLVKSVLKSKDYFKKQMLEEIKESEDFIETYKQHVHFMEIKEQEFKAKFEKILLNEFHELYASYDACKLFTCIQYTNTQVFQGPEDPKDSAATLVIQLEREYLHLTSGLDSLNLEVVKQATKEFFSKDLEMMRLAHLAQRQLRECNILSKALYTSFEAPRRRCKKKAVNLAK